MLDKITAPPPKRPQLQHTLVPAGMAAFILFTATQSTQDQSPVVWVIAVLLIGFVGRQAYWLFVYRHMSDEEIAHGAAGYRGDRPGYPGIPLLEETAGRWLPHRIATGRAWGGLIFLLIFSTLWCGVIGLVSRAVWSEEGHGFAKAALVPFQLIGAGLVLASLHELLAVLRFRPTIVELSTHPVVPGQTVEVVVVQQGPMQINSLTGKIICEESATYRVGTDTRTERRVVFEKTLFVEGMHRITRGEPYRFEGDLALPATAMHSLDLGNNAVTWRLEVDGDVPNYPDFSHVIAMTVLPRVASKGGPYR